MGDVLTSPSHIIFKSWHSARFSVTYSSNTTSSLSIILSIFKIMPGSTTTSPSHSSTANNHSIDDEESALLLKIISTFDFETVNQARYKKALNARKGKHAAPNRGVRGGCRDYKVRIAKLASFYELSYDDQKRANRAYSKDVSATLKKRHKKNLFFLNRMAVKANAIRNHSNPIRSAAIAEEFNLDVASMNIDDQEGLSDEDEDSEPYVHTGLASSGEAISNLLSQRSDSRIERNRKKPTFADRPTKVSQLCRVVCSKAEQVAWKMVARANDSTYLENPPPAAPRRTTIAISLNEVKDTTKSGGVVGKRVKRTKPKIHIVANSQADFAYVMKVLYESNGRSGDSHADDFETVTLFREPGSTHAEGIAKYKKEVRDARKTARRSGQSEEDVFRGININIGRREE